MPSRIAPELSAHIRPVSELRTHPDNYRIGDRELIERSLVKYGQIRPILATPDGTIVAGNHTFLTATEDLGWEEIAVVFRDLTKPDALAYLHMDNESARGIETNRKQVIKNLELLQHYNVPPEDAGYTEDELDDMLDELAAEEVLNRSVTAQHAETEEEREARDRTSIYESERPEPKVEVMIMMTIPERQEFVGYLGVLRRHYEEDSAKNCIFRCVKETAMRMDGENGDSNTEETSSASHA
jgi:hypothetical protein